MFRALQSSDLTSRAIDAYVPIKRHPGSEMLAQLQQPPRRLLRRASVENIPEAVDHNRAINQNVENDPAVQQVLQVGEQPQENRNARPVQRRRLSMPNMPHPNDFNPAIAEVQQRLARIENVEEVQNQVLDEQDSGSEDADSIAMEFDKSVSVKFINFHEMSSKMHLTLQSYSISYFRIKIQAIHFDVNRPVVFVVMFQHCCILIYLQYNANYHRY